MFMKNTLNLAVLIIFLQAEGWLRKEENLDKISEYFILTISTLIGMNFMISAGDFLIFISDSKLQPFRLPDLPPSIIKEPVSRSRYQADPFICSFIRHSAVRTFNDLRCNRFDLLCGYCRKNSANGLIALGFVFFVSRNGIQDIAGAFPLLDSRCIRGAPIGVTSYLSVVSKGAAAFIFTIILFTVFKNIVDLWQPLIYTLAVFTMTLANLFALRQDNIKRFLAFSSIAQAGFILLGVLAAGELGMTSVVILYWYTIHQPGSIRCCSGHSQCLRC